jgi:hypothetical protein
MFQWPLDQFENTVQPTPTRVVDASEEGILRNDMQKVGTRSCPCKTIKSYHRSILPAAVAICLAQFPNDIIQVRFTEWPSCGGEFSDKRL